MLSIDQSDFMRYMEVENHDDFFNFSDDGTVQVRDQRGVTIMYDSALEDLKEVEHELMRVGTLYMNMTTLKQWSVHQNYNDYLYSSMYMNMNMYGKWTLNLQETKNGRC